MSDPLPGDAAQPPTSLPLPPASAGDRAAKGRISFPLACAMAACLVLVPTVLQNLWENFLPLWDEAREGPGLWPMIVLCAAALLVALVIVGLLIRRIKRLLISLRMTAAVLLALIVLFAASQMINPEGRLAGPVRSEAGAPGRSPPSTRQALDDRIMVIARTAHLHEPGTSWAVIALLGFLAAGSAAGILWRRPLGAREFGFIAVHLGILAILVGMAAGRILGQRFSFKLVPGATPAGVPPRSEGEPDFRIRMVQPEIVHRPPAIRLFAAPAGGGPERILPIDVQRQGRISWRGLEISAPEFRESAVPELYAENVPGRSAVPTVRIRLTAPTGEQQEATVPTGAQLRGPAAPLGVVLAYERQRTAQEAEDACRRPEELGPDRLELVGSDGRSRGQVELPSGRGALGQEFNLGNLHLKVLRRFQARRGPSGAFEEVPKSAGAMTVPEAVKEVIRSAEAVTVLELAPAGPGADPKAVFRVAAGQGPTAPEGKVPPEIQGLQLAYFAEPTPNGARLVEGPAGTFRLMEIEEGMPVRGAALPIGGEATLATGIRFKLLEFIPEAQPAYRPAAAPRSGPGRPAVRLEVRGSVQAPVSFWLFPGVSGPRELGDIQLSARAEDRGLSRASAVVEITVERGSLGEQTLAMGRPLRLRGWQLTLRRLLEINEAAPKTTASAVVNISRDPAIWIVYVGMALLALGAPWLLWTRLRRVPETSLRED